MIAVPRLFPCRKVLERITATDLEVGVRGEIEGVVAKEGTVTVNAKKLYEIIREAPDDQVFSIRDHPSRRRGSLLDDRVNAQLTKKAIE